MIQSKKLLHEAHLKKEKEKVFQEQLLNLKEKQEKKGTQNFFIQEYRKPKEGIEINNSAFNKSFSKLHRLESESNLISTKKNETQKIKRNPTKLPNRKTNEFIDSDKKTLSSQNQPKLVNIQTLKKGIKYMI